MQEPGGSPPLSSFFERLKHLEGEARRLAERLKGFAVDPDLVVAYEGTGLLAASTAVWYAAAQGRRLLAADVPSALYHLVAYAERLRILAISSEASPALRALLDATRLLGHDALAVVPRRPTGGGWPDNVIGVDAGDELEFGFVANVAMLMALVGGSGEGARFRRLREHAGEGFAAVAEELAERYSRELEAMAEAQSPCVVAPQALGGAGDFVARALAERGATFVGSQASLPASCESVIVLSTSADEPFARLASARARLQGKKVVNVSFNFDLFEASVYASILGILLRGVWLSPGRSEQGAKD
ncbi:MAG: hypothetical protein ABWK00_04230 [Desulfurococcaceae archaeon]